MHHPQRLSPGRLRAARLARGLAVAFLLWDSVIKLLAIGPVIEAFARLGFPAGAARGIGALELTCTLLFLAPRTSVLGAALLTGFLGGAVALHMRVGDPLLTHTFFPVYVGLLALGGLLLRDPRLLSLLRPRVEA